MNTPNLRHSSFQRYRIQVIAQWPESTFKQTALKSAQAALSRELAVESGWRQAA
jgi:hypothetical protein